MSSEAIVYPYLGIMLVAIAPLSLGIVLYYAEVNISFCVDLLFNSYNFSYFLAWISMAHLYNALCWVLCLFCYSALGTNRHSCSCC